MDNLSYVTPLSASVSMTSSTVEVRIDDRRSESMTLFPELTDEQRDQLARDAWTIGLRALSNARSHAQEARLGDIGQALMSDVGQQLTAYAAEQQRAMQGLLAQFFDPADGQVVQRIQAFVGDQGVLVRQMEKFLGAKNSVLAETLPTQVGEHSLLLQRLNPNDSRSFVSAMEAQLRKVLCEHQTDFVRALDPLAEDGAVARFLRSLRDELAAADDDRAKQLGTALAALNANDEASLISRLARETQQAQSTLIAAMNPSVQGSPMAILKATLEQVLGDQTRQQAEINRLQVERQERMEKDLREALARLDTRRAENEKTPRGGLAFEDAVAAYVCSATRGGPCATEATGHSIGTRARCKKGDLVIRFTEESVFSGEGVVIEAKRDASYTVSKALEELDEAKANRGACTGVFVMARSHAPVGFPQFARYGTNILVQWDCDDQSTDTYLHAAILLGMALVSRAKPVGEPGDIHAIQAIETRIGVEIERLAKMEKSTDAIRKHANGLADEIRKAQDQMDAMLRDARSTLRALNIEVSCEDEERRTPVLLPADAMENGRDSLTKPQTAA